jgi:5-methyltetrahydropteroyltriglutamate--homocysteine methyltransferase
MKTTVIGAYPKIGDDLASQELRRALHRHDRREIEDAELDKIYDDATARAIAEIQELGVDVINDGQIRWDDPLAPFARAWSGVERGPLERFYDNNTYFRQPVITGPIGSDGRTLLRDVGVARKALKLRRFDQFKAAVVGPLTFATLAQDEHYRSIEDRVFAVADAVAREIEGLVAAGVNLIDVEDPAIVALPKHIEIAREAYVRLARAGANLCLATYFFPADPVLEALASFPVYAVAIDVRSRDTTAFDRLDAFRNQVVVLGAVDARNTRLETGDEVARYAERALRLVPEDRLWLSPTTSLEYLPRDVAKAKVGALVEGARKAAGEKVPA